MAKRYLYAKEHFNNEYDAPVYKGDVGEVTDDQLTQQLKDEGKAVEIDGSIAIEAEQKIDSLYEEYRDKINKVRESEDPLYDIPQKRDFEIAELKHEREEKHRDIMVEYETKKKALVEEAKKEQALATTKYSEADKQKANDIVERFTVNAIVDYPQALSELQNAMDFMTDEQLAAMKPVLLAVKQVIEANEDDSKIAVSKFASVVDEVKKSDPIPIADALQKLPFAESLSSKATAILAHEQAREKHGSITVEPHRPLTQDIVDR